MPNTVYGSKRTLISFALTVFASTLLYAGVAAAAPDLVLTKQAWGDPVAGQKIHYELSIANDGPDVALDVTLEDQMPDGINFIDAFIDTVGGVGGVPLPCAFTEGTNSLFCPLGDIPVTTDVPVRVFLNVEIDSSVPSGTEIINTADVLEVANGDSNASNNSAEAAIIVTSRANVEVRISSSPLAPVAGESFRWIYEVENTGTADATNLKITDSLPAGFYYVDDEANGFCQLTSSEPDVIECRPSGSAFSNPPYVLPAGETVQFEILVALNPDLLGRYTNLGSVSVSNPNFSVTSFADDVEVVGKSDLRIWAAVLPENQVAGEQMKYFIVVDNLGPSTARNVWIQDTMTTSYPELFRGNGCSLSVKTEGGSIALFNCNFALSTGLFDLAAMGAEFLRPRGSATADPNTGALGGENRDQGRIQITIEGTATEGMDLNNLVDTGSDTIDPDPSNNVTSAASSFTSLADLSITKTALGEVLDSGSFRPLDPFNPGAFPDGPTFVTSPDQVAAGRRIRYSMVVHNDGPSTAENVVVTDTLPRGVTLVPGSLTINQGSCSFGTPGDPDDPMSCTLGTMYPPGHDDYIGDITITVDVMVDLDTAPGSVIVNGAEVWSDTMDLDNSENVDGVLTLVRDDANRAEIELRKSSSPLAPVAGETFRWIYEIENTGLAAATNVEFVDTLPAGFHYVDDEANGFCTKTASDPDTIRCRPTGNAFTNPPYVLAAGDAVHFEILVAIDPDVIGQHTNLGGVSLGNANFSVTSFGDDVEVVGKADLRITKIGPTEANAGEQVTYTIMIDNLGPSSARNVAMRDDIVSNQNFSLVGLVDDPDRSADSCAQKIPTFTINVGCDLNEALEPVGWGGGSGRWLVQVTVQADEAQALTSIAEAYTNDGTPDPAPGNNQASLVTPIEATVDLAVAVSAMGEVQQAGLPGEVFDITTPAQPFPDAPSFGSSATHVTAGRRIAYSMTIDNKGPSTAENVLLKDQLPSGVSIYPGSIVASQGNCSSGSPGNPLDPMSCGLGTIVSGASASVDFQVLVSPDSAPGSVVDNDVLVSSDAFDPVNGDNFGNALTSVKTWADMSITKLSVGETVSGYDLELEREILEDLPGRATAGYELRYQISVQNNGASTARNVQILDLLPGQTDSGLDHDPVVFLYADGADCNPMNEQQEIGVFGAGGGKFGQVIWCNLGAIAPGARQTIDLYVRVDESVPGGTTLSNGAFVWWGASSPPAQPGAFLPFPFPQIPPELPTTDDSFLDNNFASSDTDIDAVADLSISKTATPEQASEGEEVRFMLQVTNNGPSVAHDVELVDTIPAGLSFADSIASLPVSCNEAANLVTCDLGDMASGMSRAVEIVALVDADVPPDSELLNTATVSSLSTDYQLQDNAASAAVLVNGSGIDPLTQMFAPNALDLQGAQLEMDPWTVPAEYDVCVRFGARQKPLFSTPNVLDLGDDDAAEVVLAEGRKVRLYGLKYDRFYVGSNGYLTFDSADTQYVVNLDNHFSKARISALFTDLDPTRGGEIWWAQEADRVVVAWEDVWSADQNTRVTVIVTIYFNGRIYLSYPSAGVVKSIVGLSKGLGEPDPFLESDFVEGSYQQCLLRDGFEG